MVIAPSDLMSLKFARNHNVIIFCSPPPPHTHTTHDLDCSLFKLLKDRRRQECHKFYYNYPGTVISKLSFNFVFRNIWLNAITPVNVISGFRKTGVHPFNRHAISCVSASSSSATATPRQISEDLTDRGKYIYNNITVVDNINLFILDVVSEGQGDGTSRSR